jgi:MFS family permease
VAGRASDIAGGKAMYTIGTIWVAVWTMIAGFMRNGIAFFVCRGLAGVGASLTMASNIRECSRCARVPGVTYAQQSLRCRMLLILFCDLGIIVENSAPGRTRGILIGVCVAGLPFGNAIGMLVSGPVAEARGCV